MKLKPEQLTNQLRQQLLPLYWVAGDEPLLVQEATDLIRQQCRSLGIQDREVYTVERGFNWETFNLSINNLSLFADKKLYELRLSSATLEDSGKAALQAFIDSGNNDYMVLVSSPRLETATVNTKWFKALEQHSAFVAIWPLASKDLPAWLSRRLLQHGIKVTPEALNILIDKIEGNLLAAMQEIEKLKLLHNPDKGNTMVLDAEMVLDAVADNSRYNVFHLIDAALLGDGRRTLKILQGLRGEALEIPPMVGAFNKELNNLLLMAQQVQQGANASAVVDAAHVIFTRKHAVVKCLQRLAPEQLWLLLNRLMLVDHAVKGMSLADPWDELSTLALNLAGVPLALEELS